MSEKDDHEMVYEQLSEESGLRKVAELIKHLRIAMLTTAASTFRSEDRWPYK